MIIELSKRDINYYLDLQGITDRELFGQLIELGAINKKVIRDTLIKERFTSQFQIIGCKQAYEKVSNEFKISVELARKIVSGRL